MFSCVLISLLEIKCCASFKNEFLMGRVGGGGRGESSSPKFLWGLVIKGGRGLTDLELFGGPR